MMKYSVKDLVVGDVGARDKYDLESDFAGIELPEEVKGKEVAGKVTFTKLEESILAEASLSAKVNLICDRCLDNFDTEIEFEFSREYLLNRQDQSPEELYVDKYMDIDVARPVREELLLAIPMKNLCREDCKGICPNCGVNLNKEECLCNPKVKSNKKSKN